MSKHPEGKPEQHNRATAAIEADVYRWFRSEAKALVHEAKWQRPDRDHQKQFVIRDFARAYIELVEESAARHAELFTEAVLAAGIPLDETAVLDAAVAFARFFTAWEYGKPWDGVFVALSDSRAARLQSDDLVPDAVASEFQTVTTAWMGEGENESLALEIFRDVYRGWGPRALSRARERVQLKMILRPALQSGLPAAAAKPGASERGALQDQEWLKRQKSLTQKQAASSLGCRDRTIRNYVKAGKLNQTPKRRIAVDEKFWSQYHLTHLPPK